jgi:tRNA nucleotidyltransferase (CCA-adding enzyme)
MEAARTLLRQVSGDRLRHELDLSLAEEYPQALLNRLQELELLSAIHPDLSWNNEVAVPIHAALSNIPDSSWSLPEKVGHSPLRRALAYLVWLGSLRSEVGLAIAQRLRLNGEITSGLKGLYDTWQKLPELLSASPSQVVLSLEGVPLVSLYGLSLLLPSGEFLNLIHNYVLTWKNVHPKTDGDALRSLGVTPGPAYHHILNTLRSAWLDGKIKSEQEERILVQDLIKQ